MKFKRLISILICGAVMAGTVALCGCDEVFKAEVNDFFGNTMDDFDRARAYINTFNSALQSDSQEDLKNLFAPNICADERFDSQLSILANYYKGTFNRYTLSGQAVFTEGNVSYQNISFDLFTSEDVYRVALRTYRSANDSQDVGIWSLYFIDMSLDPQPYRPYRGDGNWTNGIWLDLSIDSADGGAE